MLIIILYLLMIFNISQNLHASDSKIIIDTPKESHCLCGQVRINGIEDKGIEGFLIEEMTSDFEKVVRFTYSDNNGYFEFPKASSKEMHYICVSDEKSFQTVCYKVKISKKEKRKLIIKMNFK